MTPGETLEYTVVWELGRVGPGRLEDRRREALQWIQMSMTPSEP
jgi:hypothetical protein